MCKIVFDETVELADNAMLKHKPELFYEWDFKKNDELGLSVYKVTKGSNMNVWWKCQEHNHEWRTKICGRVYKNNNCPYCSGRYVWKGFNDMWTTNPELASLLADPDDGYKYLQNSNKAVDWICGLCDNIISKKVINNINNRGLSCPKCSDGIPFGEKFIYNILKKYKIKFIYNSTQHWSKGKRYDFYLPDYDWIIETHGDQHYNGGFNKSRKYIEKIDNLKIGIAREKNIKNYIVLDVRESTVSHIIESINDSDIVKLIPNIDFIEIGKLSSSSLVQEASALWNKKEVRNTQTISDILGIAQKTVIQYLKRGAEIGWCDYSVDKSKEHGHKKTGQSKWKAVLQLDNDLKCLNLWSSVAEMTKTTTFLQGNVSSVCRGVRERAYGFKWMYKEDYDRMIQEDLSHEEYMSKYYPKTK